MIEPRNSEPIQKHDAWTREKLRFLKRFLIMFGYGRWSKIRAVSRSRCKTLSNALDTEMRPYANIFLLGLAQCIDHLPKLQQKLLALVQVMDDDIYVMVSPTDFLSISKPQASFAENAVKWTNRILMMTHLTKLVREYKQFEAKKSKKGSDSDEDIEFPSLLNFIPSTHLAKIPSIVGEGEVWSRGHDCELLLNLYENGCEKLDIAK